MPWETFEGPLLSDEWAEFKVECQLAAARALFEAMRQKAYEAGWLREFETLYYWEAHELGVKQLGK
jgi:hypothetical protein